jgi:hypothetical protein
MTRQRARTGELLTMKYVLMMHAPKGPYQIMSWPKKDIEAHIAHMVNLNHELQASGEFVSAEGLTSPDQAKLVRAGKRGEPVTDGIFPESKEFLAGFWIVDVESAERAYQIAARASTAPGIGGGPMNMSLEVRQVMSGPPEDF